MRLTRTRHASGHGVACDMVQRWSFVIWTVSLAFVVYALLAWGLVRRVFGVFVYTISMSGVHRWKPRPDEDLIFGISPSDFPKHINVVGLQVPTSVLVAAFITIHSFPST